MAHLCDINPKTLRYYDRISLIQPTLKSPETGYRYYAKEQAFTIYIIKKLQHLEFSLKEIKELLESNDIRRYEEEIGNKIFQLDKKIENLNKVRNEGKMLLNKISNDLDFYNIHDIKSESSDPYSNIILEYIPVKKVYYTLNQMHDYNNFEISIERWFEIHRLIEQEGLLQNGRLMLRYLTDSVMDQFYKSQIQLEVCLPVEYNDDISQNNEHIKEIGGFKAATYYHYGQYNTIYQSHLDILRWIDANGYKVSGHLTEEYLISPLDLNSDGNYLTKIIYPISKV